MELKKVKRIAIGIGTGILIIFLGIKCTTVIPAGNVGAVYDKLKRGVQDYTLSEGLHIITPWQSIKEFPTSIETIYMSKDKREGSETDESITISCSDGSLNSDIVFSYRYDASKVPEIQRKYRGKTGQQIVDEVLRGQLRSWVSEVTKSYNSMEVHMTKKEEINTALTEHLNKKGEKFGITFENVALAETRASSKVQDAIEKRQQISQEVEQQKLELEKAEIAKQKAQLEADKKIIEAKGEKEANEIKSKGLTDKILKEKAIDKWNGEYPQVVGSDDVLIDLGI